MTTHVAFDRKALAKPGPVIASYFYVFFVLSFVISYPSQRVGVLESRLLLCLKIIIFLFLYFTRAAPRHACPGACRRGTWHAAGNDKDEGHDGCAYV